MDKHLRVVASHINKDDIYYKCPYYPEKCYKEFHLHGNSRKSLDNTTTHRIINGCCGMSQAHNGVYITINDDTRKIKKRKLSAV